MLAGRRSEFLARSEGRIVLAAALLATILFGTLALLRHSTFHSTASDLAVFDQVLWNTIHGRFMESTMSLARCEPHSFFGDHFSPALLLIVPLYALFPHPETLIVVQTIALALGVWPIYLLARRSLLIVGSIVVFVVTLKIVIPAFAEGAPYQYLGRYASLGRDEGEIARTLLLDPLRVLSVLAKGEVGSKVVFVLSVFGPGLGLALRSRWALIPSLPTLGYLMLSDYGGEHTLHNQYGAPLIPLALGASILGVAALGDRRRRRVTIGVVVSSLFLAFAFGGLPLSLNFADAFLRGEPNRAPSGEPILARESRYEPFLAAVRAIPADAPVSSRDFFTTQLPQRRLNYNLVGLDVCDAQYVILDYAAPSVNRDPAKHLAEVDAVKQLGFEEIASGVGLSLLRRR